MDCPYYHGNIDGHEAENRLIKQDAVDGTFLIRDSGSSKGVYILCLLFEKKLYQYRILTDKNKTFYVESMNTNAVRQTKSLNELVELYLSKGASNGLKTALVRGVRKDGAESDSESEDDEMYVDTKYVFGAVEKDSTDSVIASVGHQGLQAQPALPARIKSTHIYAEPAEVVKLQNDSENKIKSYYKDQLSRTDKSKVSTEFVKKVQTYIDQDLVTDVMDMSKEESKLSFNHLHLLKDLIHSETSAMRGQLTEFLHRIEYLRDVLARPGADTHQQRASHIDSESSFNTLVGLLSKTKQELCTLELEAVNSYNEMTGYANVDPLAIKRTKAARPDIPLAVFEVRSGGKAILSGPASLTLRVDMQKGALNIVKESSQTLDQSNTFSADKILQVIKSTQNSRLLEILIDGRRKETFYFDNIREREHFCQLIEQLKKVHSRETVVNSLSVFCGTWNMGNEMPPQLGGLQPWIKSQGVGKTRVASLAPVPHDLYAIGTQEAKVSEKDWVNKLKRLLHNQFNIEFHLVDVCTLWQIRLVIFIRPEHKNRISRVQQAVVRTGIANALGNKGAATISLNFDGTSMCFMCCHLAANRERLARRNQNSRDIIKNLAGSLGNKNFSDFDVTNQFSHVFCLGDLNYRVDGEIKEVLELANHEQYSEMLKMDQLLSTVNKKRAFYGFDEEMITFPPTYRYHKQASKDFNWKKVKSSGIKINAPSWCDRVIWKSLPNCAITNTSYGLVQDVISSDHKPVFASFSIQILPLNIPRSVGSLTTPIEIKVSKLSCQLMTDQYGEKQTDYSVVIMGQCLQAPCESQPATSVQVSEGKNKVQWDDTMLLRPSFSDSSHLQTQHVLVAVKSSADGVVIGDAAIALLQIFQSREECNFKCDLVSLGGYTGSLRGSLKAILKDNVASLSAAQNSPPPKRSSGNIIVTDVYASPLSALTWDEDAPATPISDTIPRIRDRPMSFVSSKQNTGFATRSLPPVPHDYDLPPNQYDTPLSGAPAALLKPPPGAAASSANQPNSSRETYESSDYYNSGSSYYNVTKLKPGAAKSSLASHPAPALASQEDDIYEDAEDALVSSSKPAVVARSEPVRPKVPARTMELPSPVSQHVSTTQGTNAVTSWLLKISMPQYVAVFKENNWTEMNQLVSLTSEQLSTAGVKSHHLFLLLDAIRGL